MKQKVLFKTVTRPTKDNAGVIQVHNVKYGAGPGKTNVVDYIGNIVKAFGQGGLYNAYKPSEGATITNPTLYVGIYNSRSRAGHALQRVYYNKALNAAVTNSANKQVEVSGPTTAVVEPPENLVTRQIAAEVLGCSKDALRKRIKRGTVQVRDGLVVLPA